MTQREVLIAVSLAISACTPRLTARPSQIVSRRVIAVRSEPAEAAPGTTVRWIATVVSPDGAVDDAPIDWQFCMLPRSPNESTTVPAACLDGAGFADGGSPLIMTADTGHRTMTAPIPTDACERVGPQVVAMANGMQRQRPPDPDITGGYQLPLRLTWVLDDARDVTFARQRIHCDLPDAPIDVAREYQRRYHSNENPALSEARLGGDMLLARDAATGPRVARGATLQLSAAWAPESVESYVLVDPATRAVAERTEQLEASWFSNAGVFEHDRTAADDGTRAFNTLRLDADRSGPVTIWLVLRDDRGGVDAASYVVEVE